MDEVCLVSVPAGGMLAACEAVDSINRPLELVTSGLRAALASAAFNVARLNGHSQTHRLHRLSVARTRNTLVYTHQGKRIRAGNSVFG